MGKPIKLDKICEPLAIGGNKVMTITYWSGPANYANPGDNLIAAKDLGLSWIYHVELSIADSGDRILYPLLVGGPVKQFDALITDLAGAEVANASNQTTKKFRIVAIGTY